MKLRTWTISGLVGCLLYAVPLSAQPSLPNDFALGTDSIILPEYLRADAGYPAWRIVTMEGKQAVPYTYCTWLLATQSWTLPIFGPNAWQAEKNCADGITAVSRLNLDQSVPRVGNDSQFWRQRPVGYQYMVPDSTLSQAEFDSLMPPASGATVKFVENPRQLADFMADVTERLSALEEWRQSLNDSGGAVTQDSLRTWLLENNYIQQSDLPDVSGFLTKEQIITLVDDKLPDTSAFLTKDAADKLYQQKGVETSRWTWWDWVRYLVIALPVLLILLLMGLMLRQKKERKTSSSKSTYKLQPNQLQSKDKELTASMETLTGEVKGLRGQIAGVQEQQAATAAKVDEVQETATTALIAANATAESIATASKKGVEFRKTPDLHYLNDGATSKWELLVDGQQTIVSFTRKGDKWYSDLPRNPDGTGESSPYTNVDTEHLKAKLRDAHRSGRLQAHMLNLAA